MFTCVHCEEDELVNHMVRSAPTRSALRLRVWSYTYRLKPVLLFLKTTIRAPAVSVSETTAAPNAAESSHCGLDVSFSPWGLDRFESRTAYGLNPSSVPTLKLRTSSEEQEFNNEGIWNLPFSGSG